MKRILMVTTNYPPANTVGTQRIIKLCKYLNHNWEIYVLTLKEKYFESALKNEKFNDKLIRKKIFVYRTAKINLLYLLSSLRNKIFNSENNKEINPNKKRVVQTPKSHSVNKGLFYKTGKILSDLLEFPDKEITWTPIALIKGLFVLKRHEIDTIFSSSPRASNHLISTMLKKITKKRLIIEFRDPWARSPWGKESSGNDKLTRFKKRMLVFFEKWAVENADKIILVTEAMRNEYVDHYKYIDESRFKVFYNGYDPEELERRKTSNDLKSKKFNKIKKIKFAHIGNLYKKRDPTPLIKAVKELIEEGKLNSETVQFRFVGVVTSEIYKIKDLIIEYKLDNIIQFLPQVPYLESLKYMEDSDILILIQPSTKLQLPAKIFNYMCFDKTIFAIGEKQSEVEKFVKQGFGVFKDYNNIEEIKEGIIFLVNNQNYYVREIKEKRKKYNVKRIIAEYENIF